MAPFYTDPRITLAGMREPESFPEILTRFMQLKQLAQRGRLNDLQEKEALLRLKEIERATLEDAATRKAMAAGVQRAPQISNEMPVNPELQGVLGPSAKVMTQPPRPGVSFDRQAALASLAEGAPQLVSGMEQQFQTQDAAAQKSSLDVAASISKLNKEQLETAGKRLEIMGTAALSILQAPPEIKAQVYAATRQNLIQQGIIRPEDTPEQYSPQMDPWIQAQATQAGDYWKMVQERRQQMEAEERTRHNKAVEEKKVPGRDVPLPPDVAQQRKEIAQAGRAQPTAIVQTVDEQGNPVTRIVPKVAGSEFVAPPTVARAGVAQAQERAQPVIREMESLSKQINLGSGVSAVVTGRARSAMGAANYDTAVAQYEALVSGAVPLVARALGHTGVLTEQDVESTRALFPKPGDSQELSVSKWNVIHAVIKGQGNAGPAIGTVENGYRFKGGNPADPKNWEKVN